MKVLHVDTGKDWRGGQAQVLNLIRFLPGYVDSHLITPNQSELRKKINEYLPSEKIHTHSLRGEWDLTAAWFLRNLHLKHNFDVIHAHSSRGLGISWVSSFCTDLPPLIETRRLEKPVGQNWLSRRKYSAVDHHIAISEPVESSLVESGIPEKDVTIIPSGVDFEKFSQAEPNYQILEKHGIPTNTKIIGNIGALNYEKNQKNFIEAAEKVLKNYPDCQFVIAGDGDLYEKLNKKIQKNNLGNNVHLLGFIEDISGLINTLDLFVLTSVFEGLCSTLLQVMAAGVPVIATKVGGVPDLIQDNQTGLLIPPETPEKTSETINSFLRGKLKIQQMKSNAQYKAQDYDYSNLSLDVTECYGEVLNH